MTAVEELEADGMAIDENIKSLVNVLNEIPGCSTYGSCGGHELVEGVSQSPEDEFSVELLFSRSHLGWKALDIITAAMNDTYEHGEDGSRYTLIAWMNGEALAFNLSGMEFADPDVLARCIQRRAQG